MAFKGVNVNLSLTADTSAAKASLQSLQNTLSNLISGSSNPKKFALTQEIQGAT